MSGPRTTVVVVQRILVATDDDTVAADVDAALGSSTTEVLRVRQGRSVRAAVIENSPDLVILDLQVGSMGGMAASLDLRLEEGADRLDPQRILLLLDRDADIFLARRSAADGWLVKPLDAFRLQRAAQALLGGGEFREQARTAIG
jgi:DNA-binding response OmpR family regulator